MNKEELLTLLSALPNNAEYERTHGSLHGCLEFKQLAEWLKDYKRLLEQQPCEDAISRQAALNSLIDNTHLDGYDLAEALDAIENKEKLPPVTQKSGEWIPVSKKLPELKQRILVSYETMDDGKKVDITIHDKHGFLISGAYAWMPLPKPYEPQESEE